MTSAINTSSVPAAQKHMPRPRALTLVMLRCGAPPPPPSEAVLPGVPPIATPSARCPARSSSGAGRDLERKAVSVQTLSASVQTLSAPSSSSSRWKRLAFGRPTGALTIGDACSVSSVTPIQSSAPVKAARRAPRPCNFCFAARNAASAWPSSFCWAIYLGWRDPPGALLVLQWTACNLELRLKRMLTFR